MLPVFYNVICVSLPWLSKLIGSEPTDRWSLEKLCRDKDTLKAWDGAHLRQAGPLFSCLLLSPPCGESTKQTPHTVRVQLGTVRYYTTHPKTHQLMFSSVDGVEVRVGSLRCFLCRWLSSAHFRCWLLWWGGRWGQRMTPYDSPSPYDS